MYIWLIVGLGITIPFEIKIRGNERMVELYIWTYFVIVLEGLIIHLGIIKDLKMWHLIDNLCMTWERSMT